MSILAKFKVGVGIFACAGLFLFSGTSSAAQPEVLTRTFKNFPSEVVNRKSAIKLQPLGQWIMDYGDNNCR